MISKISINLNDKNEKNNQLNLLGGGDFTTSESDRFLSTKEKENEY